MKAYIISDSSDYDNGCDIVFANTAKEAKKLTGYTPIEVDRYIDLRVVRYPQFDGLENASEIELAEAKWREGWWFDRDSQHMPDPETATVKEFQDWYMLN